MHTVGLLGMMMMWDYKKVRLLACFCSLGDPNPGRRAPQNTRVLHGAGSALLPRIYSSVEPLICQLQYDIDFSNPKQFFLKQILS